MAVAAEQAVVKVGAKYRVVDDRAVYENVVHVLGRERARLSIVASQVGQRVLLGVHALVAC